MAVTLAVGINRGHRVTKHVRPHAKKCRKGVCGTQRRLCHDVIREVCGYAPYERRVLELLRNGFDKRALRVCKRKLGTMLRAKHKRDELTQLMQKARLERLAHAGKHEDAAASGGAAAHEEHGHRASAKDKKKDKKKAAQAAKKAEKATAAAPAAEKPAEKPAAAAAAPKKK